jgi:hypothetical protein
MGADPETDNMASDEWWIGQLTDVLEVLAASAESQEAFLAGLHVDELALNFDAGYGAVRQLAESGALSPNQVASLSAIDSKLSEMSRGGRGYSPRLWSLKGIRRSTQWAEVRRMAANALRELRRT